LPHLNDPLSFFLFISEYLNNPTVQGFIIDIISLFPDGQLQKRECVFALEILK